MGNGNSSEVDQLKQLYSMNNFQLEALRKELIEQKKINQQQAQQYQQVVNSLIQKQSGIKDKIPNNQFDKVNTFLNDVNRDFTSKQSNVSNWQPGQSVSRNVANSNRTQYYQQPQPPQHQTYQTHQLKQQPNMNNPNANYDNNSRDTKPRDYNNVKKNENEIDPYKLYKLERDKPFSLDKLKETYKEYALKTHPDVEGGSERNFSIVNNAYKYLVEEHKKMETDKQFNQLKNDSMGYLESQEKSGKINKDFAGRNFDVNKFNSVFQDNRIEDTASEGYNSWLTQNQYDSEDIQRNNSLTTGNFNDQFNSNVKVGKELQVYKIPEVLNSSISGSVQELGVDRTTNYSGGSDKMKYTDLKEAHTTSRLVDPNTKYNKYRSVNELQFARTNMGDLSSQEQLMIEEVEESKKRDQIARESNQRRMDRMFSDHHNKMHSMFIGNRM